MSVLRDLMRLSPIPVGETAPPLSLTADEGTWVKLRDFEGVMAVALVFVRTQDDETEAWLKSLDAIRADLESVDTAIYAVHTAATDQLRDYRAHLRSGIHFLYDPLALTARAFGVSSRVLPRAKDAVVLVDKQQKVVFVEKDKTSAQTLLEQASQATGKPLPGRESAPQAASAQHSVRNPGEPSQQVQDIDSVQAEELLTTADSAFILVDVRTKSEFDADHSVHATHVPVDELPHRYRELGQTDHIIFVCQGGDRSAAAAEFMTSVGAFEIYNVLEGMSSWAGPRERTPVEDQ